MKDLIAFIFATSAGVACVWKFGDAMDGVVVTAILVFVWRMAKEKSK